MNPLPSNPSVSRSSNRSAEKFSAAVEVLAAADPVIRRLAAETGPVRIPRPRSSHFAALVQAIVFQQLATAAARAIHRRLLDARGGVVEPETVAAMTDEAMRAVGLSGNKTRSLHDLSAKVLDGTVDLSPRRLARRPDEEIVERLTSVRGIGPWSAEMFLIFQLRRVDVWPTSDLGIRRGYGIAWHRPTPTERELAPLGNPYRPYRTVLAWYCWQADSSRVHE
jgi:DNA-3-methyladenine glycosylase II